MRRYKGPLDGWALGVVASVAVADGQRVEAILWTEGVVNAGGVPDGRRDVELNGSDDGQVEEDLASNASGRTEICDEVGLWNVVPIIDVGMCCSPPPILSTLRAAGTRTADRPLPWRATHGTSLATERMMKV
mmetsp:Transcript_44532/g.142811  ORF Transcript_44532/g.142811 Transcript_44532/m.142811 type:complete len:132 (+) Transcript_44532:1072-1467(+)